MIHMKQVYEPIKIGPLSTSKAELKQLGIAWLAISIAFANVLSGGRWLVFPQMLFISAVTVGTGFFFHELGHKIMAQKYGCFAEFRAFINMLVFAVIISFAGFVFAAPGAVMIAGRPTRKQNGIISLAGPLVNLVFAYIFFIMLTFSVAIGLSGFILTLFGYGFLINTWLALFNLLPIGNFDGRKILHWNKGIYGITVALAAVMFLSQMISL
jgi:Zn-dependent protease